MASTSVFASTPIPANVGLSPFLPKDYAERSRSRFGVIKDTAHSRRRFLRERAYRPSQYLVGHGIVLCAALQSYLYEDRYVPETLLADGVNEGTERSRSGAHRPYVLRQ